jgi:hypothetical protein
MQQQQPPFVAGQVVIYKGARYFIEPNANGTTCYLYTQRVYVGDPGMAVFAPLVREVRHATLAERMARLASRPSASEIAQADIVAQEFQAAHL